MRVLVRVSRRYLVEPTETKEGFVEFEGTVLEVKSAREARKLHWTESKRSGKVFKIEVESPEIMGGRVMIYEHKSQVKLLDDNA